MSNRYDKSRKKRSAVLPVLLLMIALAFLTIAVVFFRVYHLEVEGSKVYTAEQVIEASRIETGDNTLLVSRSAAAMKICSALPYVEEVRVVKKLPSTIVIKIKESAPIGCIDAGSSCWIINSDCKLLEDRKDGDTGSLIEIRGAVPIMPKEGDTLSLEGAESTQLSYLKAVLSELESAGIAGDVQWLDIENISSIKFLYLGRFTVNLGGGSNVADKLRLLKNVVPSIDEAYLGTIDLSEDGQARFIRSRD